jgi:hypothetical protein
MLDDHRKIPNLVSHEICDAFNISRVDPPVKIPKCDQLPILWCISRIEKDSNMSLLKLDQEVQQESALDKLLKTSMWEDRISAYCPSGTLQWAKGVLCKAVKQILEDDSVPLDLVDISNEGFDIEPAMFDSSKVFDFAQSNNDEVKKIRAAQFGYLVRLLSSKSVLSIPATSGTVLHWQLNASASAVMVQVPEGGLTLKRKAPDYETTTGDQYNESIKKNRIN